jgi:hypothetical protein
MTTFAYVAAALSLAFLGASVVWALVLYRLGVQALPRAFRLLRDMSQNEDARTLRARFDEHHTQVQKLDAEIQKLKEEQTKELLGRRPR